MKTIPIPPGVETKHFVLARGAVSKIPSIINKHWGSKPVWPVADENTWRVAGDQLTNVLHKAKMQMITPFIFPGQPTLRPDILHAQTLAKAMPEKCVPVAVGSGTLNDLLKYAVSLKKSSYIVIPTAPSVDGYTASGAALTENGFKRTVPCSAPLVVITDPDILATAPAEMFSAGYADLMAKIPAGADWIVADFLGLSPIRHDVWELVQNPLRTWLELPANVDKVFTGLVATGYAMQMCRDSRPASGAEHLISHVWEMEGIDALHGLKVSIASVITTALYETLLQYDPASLRKLAAPGISREDRSKEMDRLLIRNCYGNTVKTIAMEKFLEGDKLIERRETLYAGWDQIREKVQKQLIPLEQVKIMLKTSGAPTHPSEIGIPREQYIGALSRAQLIRNRHTVLDLVYELGLSLESLAGKILEQLSKN